MPRTVPLVAALFLLGRFLLPASGQVSGAGSIQGQTIHAITGAPLRDVVISLTGPYDTPVLLRTRRTLPSAARAISDEHGYFQFSGLRPGFYQATTRRSGFVTSAADRAALAVDLIPVRAGEQVRDVSLKLTPASAVTGKIVDATGEPLEDATVSVLQVTWSVPGRPYYSQVASTRTDDRGVYWASSLPAGTYSLRVDPPALLTQFRDPAGLGYATTYYPDSSDPAGMKMFEVSVGATKSVDMKLKKSRVFRVSGRSVGSNGLGSGPGAVELLRADSSRQTAVGTGTSARMDGTFEIAGVPAGSYVLAVASNGANTASFGRRRVDVAADIETVTVQLAPSGPISGTVRIEGEAAGSLSETEIHLCRVDNGAVVSSGNLNDDLSFSFPNTAAGQYTVCVAHLPAPYYVKSVLWDGKEVPGTGLDSAFGGKLSIVVSTEGAARVEGTVQDSSGQPAPYALVTVFPLDGNAMSALTGQAGAGGDFAFQAVRPGTYKLLAWESGGSALVMQSAGIAWLKQFDGQSATVTLPPGGREKTRLTPISAEEKQQAFSAR
jgi:protocatechuate 3,4-dioxygenase beta subunit